MSNSSDVSPLCSPDPRSGRHRALGETLSGDSRRTIYNRHGRHSATSEAVGSHFIVVVIVVILPGPFLLNPSLFFILPRLFGVSRPFVALGALFGDMKTRDVRRPPACRSHEYKFLDTDCGLWQLGITT
ncbi:hypothetical protein NUW58_g1571 [Xylaria curta]|uniref:Uncharacterized protein n=1 Tax=Xylaria curta TaxID=42375 RepID=A0ACC1PMW4_9PEZI|nr:hypothetical protein NUW58_g1571 [Xylaria curta]